MIAVILGGQTGAIRFNEAKKLLDYGFANYDSHRIGKKGDLIKSIPIEKSDVTSVDLVLERDVYALLPKGNKGDVDKEIVNPDTIQSPISKGDTIGELIISLDGKEIDRVNLVAKDDVQAFY